MRDKIKNIGIIASLIISFTSCEKDSFTLVSDIENFENGYFVTNEGSFGTGNGSISFISNLGEISNNVFYQINSFILGDVVQSMSIIDNKGYIIVNNSSKIEVTSIDSMNSIATIQGLISPRYIIKASDQKAYVSDWGINGIHIINLNTNTIISTINTGTGPEKIVISNGNAYVCNIGGWGLDNTVTVIDIETDMVISTVEVGDKPNSAVVDENGEVWILSGGYTEYDTNWNIISETTGFLKRINTFTNTVDKSYAFPLGNHPEDLVVNESKNKLYFSDGSWNKSVYEFNINDSQLPTNSIINRSFYDLGYHNGYIFGTDAVDYVQNGWSYQYNLSGILIDSVQVGIIPGGYCFN